MSFLDPRQWIMVIAFLGAAFLGVKFWEHRLVQKGFDAGYAKSEQVYKARDAKAQAEAAAKTARLQTAVDTARKEKNDAIASLRAQHAADLERLRQRPARPANLPQTAGDGQASGGCTGAQLYRDDAELLVRESLRAETVRLDLLACYAQYDRARAEVNGTP
mgnify:FL=1